MNNFTLCVNNAICIYKFYKTCLRVIQDTRNWGVVHAGRFLVSSCILHIHHLNIHQLEARTCHLWCLVNSALMSQMAYLGVGETQVQNWLISQVFPIEKFCGHIQCVPIHFLEGNNYRIHTDPSSHIWLQLLQYLSSQLQDHQGTWAHLRLPWKVKSVLVILLMTLPTHVPHTLPSSSMDHDSYTLATDRFGNNQDSHPLQSLKISGIKQWFWRQREYLPKLCQQWPLKLSINLKLQSSIMEGGKSSRVSGDFWKEVWRI
jgi:hypothetical protein